ncbi:uncharacterized protein A4U43_C03F12780 [Asparagus officinalis]|uniref:Uncharacterized protein n=1 Tax=Asparagus officinalis TaxID=4686 RepID=A0A5P1F9K6_ASPOF|nr:uncharacterized protein A4U43_C03F12780 [Asparagus officinalis]
MQGATVAFTYVKHKKTKTANDTLATPPNSQIQRTRRTHRHPTSRLRLRARTARGVVEASRPERPLPACDNPASNTAAEQYVSPDSPKIKRGGQLDRVFRTNIFSHFLTTKYALKHMPEGGCIINTTSVNAYKGNARLLDYTATKGAIVAFTRALALQVVEKGIRVNGVAPGPVWTPLIPASFPEDQVKEFGKDVPMGRAGQPYEIAPSYVFLACSDSSYISGQVLHPNGGTIVNG